MTARLGALSVFFAKQAKHVLRRAVRTPKFAILQKTHATEHNIRYPKFQRDVIGVAPKTFRAVILVFWGDFGQNKGCPVQRFVQMFRYHRVPFRFLDRTLL